MTRRFRLLLSGWVAACFALFAASAFAQADPAGVRAVPVAASAPTSAAAGEILPGPAVEDDDEAEEFHPPAATHVWLRFAPGAWRRSVVTTQTLSPEGETLAVGVTTRDETLASAESDRYVLQSRATVTTLGRVIEGQWVDASYSALFDGPGNLVAQQRLDDEAVIIDGQNVNCAVWQLQYDDGGRRMSDQVWFSAEVFPHVLMRRRLTLADDPTAAPDRMETVEVVAGALPYHFGEDLLTCACVRTTREGPKGRTVEISLLSETTPGGQVVAWSTDWDAEGRRVRTTVAETVEFGTEPVDRSLLPRRQLRQQRRAAR